jgi:hypothetical protein
MDIITSGIVGLIAGVLLVFLMFFVFLVFAISMAFSAGIYFATDFIRRKIHGPQQH